MIQLTHKLPEKYWVAVSGGIDSMAALNWLYKPNNKKLQGIIHINHGTGHSKEATWFVENHCSKNYNIKIDTAYIKHPPPKGESKEKFWRDKRLEVFKSYDDPVILAHNFDDCLEEYIMNS